MNNAKGYSFSGNIRLKPKSIDLRNVHNCELNLGVYDELKLPLSLNIWGDPNFACLQFKLPSEFAEIEEVNYHFHQFSNLTDTDNTFFCIDFQHMLFLDGRCYMLLEVGLVIKTLSHLYTVDNNDPFYFNGVCLLDYQPNEENLLAKFGSTQKIPVWKSVCLPQEPKLEESEIGYNLFGTTELKYFRTIRFFEYNGSKASKTIEKKQKPILRLKVALLIQTLHVDYLLGFYFSNGKEVKYVNADEQVDNYVDFLADFEENGIFLENLILANDLIFLFAKIKVNGRNGDYDFYSSMICLPASNIYFDRFCEVFNLDKGDYWNFQSVSLEKLLIEQSK
ncbi:MAG: hypothetical protein LCH37_03695 [Bacteroidetes bacterium]|nr:hypothetical protein [Bacteroidota bacterium]